MSEQESTTTKRCQEFIIPKGEVKELLKYSIEKGLIRDSLDFNSLFKYASSKETNFSLSAIREMADEYNYLCSITKAVS